MGLAQDEVARAIGVSSQRLDEVALGHRRLTAAVALRLARYLGTTPEFWTGLQHSCDLYDAGQQGDVAQRGAVSLTSPRH